MKNSVGMEAIHFEEGLAKVQLEVAVFMEGDYHVAYSPALDLVGQGKNNHEAIDSLMKAVRITLDWAREKDTIHKLLLEHGWTLQEKPTAVYRPPVFNAAKIRKSFKIGQFKTKKIPVYV